MLGRLQRARILYHAILQSGLLTTGDSTSNLVFNFMEGQSSVKLIIDAVRQADIM